MAAKGNESLRRLVAGLTDALGDVIVSALADVDVVEIMLNPDGRIFVERVGAGMEQVGQMTAHHAEIVIGKVAHALGTEITGESPIVSGELPIGGHRFEGLLPPVVSQPVFTIRKKASLLIGLDTYVADGIMTAPQRQVIRDAVATRKNIVVSGGTGTGKTTLTNAIIAEIVAATPQHRLVILEDTAEIQCAAENAVILHTSDTVDMQRLLKSTMRLRPDRIIVGEVRDGAALTLLKAWNTGHPGGIATVHSDNSLSALTRLEQLIAEVSQQAMPQVIGQAVDLIVSIERTARGRVVKDILAVDGFHEGHYRVSQRNLTGKSESQFSGHSTSNSPGNSPGHSPSNSPGHPKGTLHVA
jgi:type IV secretion system protein TrbB